VVCEQVREQVREGGLLARDRAVLVMLSGGRDSTCLLDVTVALMGAAAVSALHVNYGLRQAAAGDERHCRALCEQLAVELHVARAGGRALPRFRTIDEKRRLETPSALSLSR